VSNSFLSGLTCTFCGRDYSADRLLGVCPACGKPLFARYRLKEIREAVSREAFRLREASLWRYRELLPLPLEDDPITLGEGWTPLQPARRLGQHFGIPRLWIKDESVNPTGSFKARGMAVAVSMARRLGASELVAPSAGNAGGALAAYAARAGLAANLFMPRDTPASNVVESRATGARVTLVDGLITDCAEQIRRARHKTWFDVSTLKEPYRVEGKKTLGYELAEQMDWTLPDVILYPTGGGTGLIGMWKAFAEMEALGWIGSQRPRMVAVQAAGCQPIVRAFKANQRFAEEHLQAATLASGLRVPKAIGDFLILDALQASCGTAVAVSDQQMLESAHLIGQMEGMFVAPETGACVAALNMLVEARLIRTEDRVVVFNTGAGIKYIEAYAAGFADADDKSQIANRRPSLEPLDEWFHHGEH
jgi:threonine synthase